MPTRTYTRTYRAETTETVSFGHAYPTDDERDLHEDLDAAVTSLTGDADEILCCFDADLEEIGSLGDRGLRIERTL